MPAALTVVFDLDGTLIDTAPDLIDTLNVVLASAGLKPVEYALARNMIGGGARRMIESGLLAEGRQASRPDIDRMFEQFIAYYADHIADRSRPFPGLETTLDELARHGCRFAVCTNKLEKLSRLLLDALDLTGRFEAICGQDTFKIQKPDPEILRLTIAATGGTPDRTIMVGDSGTDIDTAHAAGIPVIAVDFGYSDPPVTRLSPDRLISHYRDLPAAIWELAPYAAPQGATRF